MLPSIKYLYSNMVIKLIVIVMYYPQITILLPTLILFLLSYNITYDLTIKQTNSYLAYYFGNFITNDAMEKKTQLLHRISSIDLDNNILSIVEFGDENNVLSYDYLNEIQKISLTLENTTHGIILSPSYIWPVDLQNGGNIPTIEKSRSIGHVVEYLNSRETWKLNYVFIDNIIKRNHLVKYAKTLKLLVFHHVEVDFESIAKELISQSQIVTLCDIHSYDSAKSIHSFVSYLDNIVSKRSSGYLNFFIQTHVFIFAILFTIFIWLTISNEGKIRSNVGLVIGWVVEVFLSSTFAMSYLSYKYESKSWKLLFELQSFGYVIFALLLLSSKHLLITINDLGHDEEFKNTSSDLPKRLYKFYQGQFKLISIPRTTFDVLFRLFSLSVLKRLNDIILNYDESVYSIYFGYKLSLIFSALMVALVVDHLLQLTYLVSIIVIDLNKVEFTDMLNRTNSNSFLTNGEKEVKCCNSITSFLLNSQSRIKKDSMRYKIAQYLSQMKYPFICNNNCIMFLIIEMFVWLSILISDVNVMPENDFLLHFFSYNVLNNSNDIFFYLELLCIVTFIEASSFLVLKVTPQSHSANSYKQVTSMGVTDFEGSEIKSLNTIELSNNKLGHNLDVLKLLTNPNTSFVVSIGLDHRILVWSPLNKKGVHEPIDISSKLISKKGLETRFWPINHINISNEGNYIILINYKHRLIRCYERRKLNFIWDAELPEFFVELTQNRKVKIIESFFRKRTVAGFLARKILQKKRDKNLHNERRGSRSSIISVSSSINGNFTPLVYPDENTIDEDSSDFGHARNDFIFILESGELLTVCCATGFIVYVNVLKDMYPESELKGLFIITAHKLITPRNYDRIIFYVSNFDIIIATAVNNKWKFRKLNIVEGYYNKPNYSVTQMTPSGSYDADHDFSSLYSEEAEFEGFRIPKFNSNKNTTEKPSVQLNKPTIVTVDFVGMIVRVIDSNAELIDIQTGILLKKFHVGHFKPSSFRVSHSEPTHCKFCGCASIQSFSIIYEDYDDNTLLVHTFRTDAQRSKNNICLRVERDPREIRCIGFNAVIEHRFSYADIEAWELTQVNVIMGIKKRTNKSTNVSKVEKDIDIKSSNLYQSGFRANNDEPTNLRSRRHRKTGPTNSKNLANDWEGFIVTAIDGQLINYKIPCAEQLDETLPINKIHTIERFGFKSIIVSFGNIIKIFYLGSNKLIENDLYYSGSNMTMNSVLEEDTGKSSKSHNIQPVNGELLFISKRREMMERSKNRRSIRPTNLSTI